MIKKRFVGFTLFTFGLLLSLSKIALTGAAIGVSASSLISLIGALTMIGGIIIIVMASGERPEMRPSHLERKLKIFDLAHGSEDTPLSFEDRIVIETSTRDFTNAPPNNRYSLTGLRAFYAQDLKGEPELAGVYREEHADELLEDANDDTKPALVRQGAVRALEIIYEVDKIPTVPVPLNHLREEEKIQIDAVFGRGWKISPTSDQTDILRNYGMAFQTKKNGSNWIYATGNTKIRKKVSNTPEENAGHNIARDVIKLINEYRGQRSEYRLPNTEARRA